MMKKSVFVLILCALSTVAVTISCKHKPNAQPSGSYAGYPDNVGKIFIDRCATAGCHNAASYTAAGGLLLDSYEHMLDGGNNGAAIIAYSPDMSPLLYFINTTANGNSDLINTPTMPEDGTPLNKDEYNTIKEWINSGAPDINGNAAFSANPDTRQKIYLTQQGCDLLAVIDAERKVVMRYIKIGKDAIIESPHCVRVSPDAKYAYVSCIAGQYIQKINTSTDKIESEAMLPASPPTIPGAPSWNILYVSPKNDQILLSDWRPGSREVLLNAANLGVINSYNAGFNNPHGITSNAAFDTFYVTSQYGNVIYKIDKNSGSFTTVSLNGVGTPTTTASQTGITPDPHEIMMLPGNNRYIVTCENTNEVRIMDAHTDALIAKIPVGKYPQELALSPKNHLAYVTCMLEPSTNAGSIYVGAVYAIDYNNPTAPATRILTADRLAQPHGITVDDLNNVLYIASQNPPGSGPAPHHANTCGGKNGYYQVFSSTPPFTQVNNKTYEVSVQPYSADVRFKQ